MRATIKNACDNIRKRERHQFQTFCIIHTYVLAVAMVKLFTKANSHIRTHVYTRFMWIHRGDYR